LLELRDGVQVWGPATMGWPQAMPWRDLSAGLAQQKVLGKSANDLQTSCPPKAICRLWPARPFHDQSIGQWAFVAKSVDGARKIQQAQSFALELKAQGASVSEVRFNLGKHGLFHPLIFGQGRATWRSSSKLTWA
jgi:hypothetical protein